MSRASCMGPFKAAVVAAIERELGIGVAAAERLYASLMQAAVRTIAANRKTVVRGVGTFTWTTRRERRQAGGLFGGTIPSYEHLKFRSYGAVRRLRKESKDGDR